MSVLTLRSFIVGMLATFTMDGLTVLTIKLGLIAPLPPRLIGRWFASVARGQLVHTDIGQLTPINYELAVEVPLHYAIGITLALTYLLMSSVLGLHPKNPVFALVFALFTCALPWFVMFPAMGYGWFGTHGPIGTRLFLDSLVTHCLYGVGLWLAASMLS
jgi:hypothetical protein